MEVTPRVRLARTAKLPDPMRVARCRRLPELGPRILFFSGGSALRGLSRALKEYTHNSIHLITPFDSGGSSARLRAAFAMLSVGDLRNRLLALADETVSGAPEIYRLFSHRLPEAADGAALSAELDRLVDGSNALVADVPEPMRRLIRTHLRIFAERMPASFDLRGASIGNLVLAGGYLNNEHDIESVIFLFSKLVEVRGTVRPVIAADFHLAAELDDGSTIVGQHLFTGKVGPPIRSRIRNLRLVADLDASSPARAEIADKTRRLILGAELIVFPMGSFYSSVVANLLPSGVGRAIVEAGCPKIYVPNAGIDPEQLGMNVADCVDQILSCVRRDCGPNVPARSVLDAVLIDTTSSGYATPLDVERIAGWGIDVVDAPLGATRAAPKLDRDRLAKILVSLC